MFKDSYRKTNDHIHVRESLLDEIKAERTDRVRSELQKKDRRRQWLVAIPTVAAATAACFAVVIGINAGKTKAEKSPLLGEQKTAEAGVLQANDAMTDWYVGETKPNTPMTVESYEQLGEIMQARSVSRRTAVYGAGINAVAEEADFESNMMEVPTAVEGLQMNGMKSEATGTESGQQYSGTNNQVEGIDEADIVKTDGAWIYTLSRSQNKIYILSAEGKETKIAASIKLKEASEKETYWRNYSEMMLYGDRLYLMGTFSDWGEKVDEQDRISAFAMVYDISDRNAPKLIATHKQQGEYRTARLIGDLLVIVSDYQLYYRYAINETDDVKEYCPKVSTDGETVKLALNEIYVNPDSGENGFTVVTTIRAKDGKTFDSHKAVLGGCSNVYCNGTDLLIASNEWSRDVGEEQTDPNGKHFVRIVSGTHTNLFRFSITDGRIEAEASTKLPGSLLNQFSMDEYNGCYRLAVTRSDTEEIIWTDGIDTYEWHSSSDCSLYVLDGALNTIGMLENLAKDENIQSVRFMGDVAYVVTFRQVDPLFSVDLRDPQHPKVLNALKIPGFSAYLHPFGEGKLLGIGYDADEKTGGTENVKLSVFDISDPANVTETCKLSVKDASYTSVQYNHKIVFVDAKTQTVAFPADDAYFVFRAEGNSFTQIGKIRIDSDWFGNARGLFIDDIFYVIGDYEVGILSFESMETLATLKLK